jgi:hypothetical protein
VRFCFALNGQIAGLIAEDASVSEGQAGSLISELSLPADRREGPRNTQVNHAHRKGTILRFPVSSPEESFHKAIEIARRQRAKSLELRATVSLARLWQQQGRKKEAHGMLVEICGWFTEGFDTVDLKEAKALLEKLN